MQRIWFLGCLSLSMITGVASVQAQAVVSDGTLNTIVTRSGNSFAIDNGTTSGSNLFHSFREFSIPTGGSAVFNNSTNIQNIFSRVTGSTVSNIDGLIQAQGSTNLFLLNPSGILFGANASLNIGGSFVGTTAQTIKFADGLEFSAVNDRPLLTMSAPIGLQMGQNPGKIVNNGARLEVPQANTLAFIGGDIQQTGGKLSVPGGNGRIELISLGENSQTTIQPVSGGWLFNPSIAQNLRDLQFTQEAEADGSGNGSASITAVGSNILVSNRSRFQGYNRGDRAGGTIALTASSSILVQEDSEIRTDVAGSGNSGNIEMFAPRIQLYNGTTVATVTWEGIGKAGNLLIQGQDVTITNDPFPIDFVDGNPVFRGSNVLSVTENQGDAGNITVIADTLTTSNNGGFVNLVWGSGNSGTTTLISRNMIVQNRSGGTTATLGTGNGGDLNIITDSFYMDGSSGYGSGAYGENAGRGGNVNITAKSIILRDNSGFDSDTFGPENAGNISLSADYIELDDAQINSRTGNSGNAGAINVSAQTFRLLNGGQLNVSTRASGDGGRITVNANAVELNGEPTQSTFASKNTGILSSVLPDSAHPNPTGKGGNINVTASDLTIRDGAIISASTSAGTGNGGNITLQLDRLEVFNGGQIMNVSGRAAENVTSSAGNAGEIEINARDRILLSGQDQFYAERQAAYVPEQEYSDVEYNIGALSGILGNSTSSSTGNGGSIKLTTGTLQVQDRAVVSVSSQGAGNAGNLLVNANQAKLSQQGSLQAESVASDQGNIFLNLNQALLLRNGSTITTNATGTANGGNITINSPILLGLENSDIIANAVEGRGGKIDITTQGIISLGFRDTLTPRQDLTDDITASSRFSVNGTVAIKNLGVDPNSGLVALPVNLSDSSQRLAQGCTPNQGSSFVISGRGGVPTHPLEQMVSRDRTWTDLRAPVLSNSSPSPIPQPQPLLEATSWFSNPQTGTVELVAARPAPLIQSVTCN
jgi:filamentous hemagglutinin family protein